jgi:hypothetical protein
MHKTPIIYRLLIGWKSDQDLDAKTAYFCYEGRWLPELVFNRYASHISNRVSFLRKLSAMSMQSMNPAAMRLD